MTTTPSSLAFTEEVQASTIGDQAPTPPAGSLVLFSNQNGNWYAKNSSGVSSEIGGLGSLTIGPYSVVANDTASTAAAQALQTNILLGAPGFADTGMQMQQTLAVAGYMQNLMQNTSNNAAASTDFIVNNDQGTASTHYGDFGINSSTFSGSGSLNLPGAVYLYSESGDLVLATNTSNLIRFLTNGASTDALQILASNLPATPGLTGYLYANAGSAWTASTSIPNSALVTAPVTSVTGTAPIASSGGTTPAISINAATSSTAGSLAAVDYAFLQAYENKTIILVTANAYSNLKCDGATDDSAALNTLFTNAPDHSTLVWPPGTMMLTSGTNPSVPGGKHFSFKGAGIAKTIWQSNSQSADFITLGDWYQTFEGITFQGLNTTVTGNIALSGTPTASLAVGSTTNFPASGTFNVQTNLGWTVATYASIVDGTHFGNVTAATSTTVAGGPIALKAGGYAINSGSNTNHYIRQCQFNYVFNGWLNNGTECGVIDSSGFGTVNFDLQFNGANVNAVVHNFTCDGVPPAVAHMEVNQCGSLLISDCDLIRAQSNMRLNPTSPNGVFGIYAVNTYFDTATGVSGTANSGNGVLLQGTGNIQRVKFANCWLSSATHDGLFCNSTATTLPTDVCLIGCNIYSNGANGIDWTAGQDFIAIGNQISGNVTAGINLVAAASSVTKALITSNRIGPAGGIGANGTGVVVAAGTYGSLKIQSNDVAGNTSASLTLGAVTVATWSNYWVSDNAGFNPHGAVTTPTFPTTTTVVTNQTGVRVSVYFKSGATAPTVVTVNGVSTVLPLASQIMTIPLDPGGTFANTFTVAGTWTWVGN